MKKKIEIALKLAFMATSATLACCGHWQQAGYFLTATLVVDFEEVIEFGNKENKEKS